MRYTAGTRTVLSVLALAFLFFAALPYRAAGQSGGYVVVSATVLDPSGVPYAGCHGSVDYQLPANATKQPTLYSGSFQRNFSISQCDSFAKFSITLAATDQIDCGLGSLGCGKWNFTINSQDGKTNFTVALTIGPGNPNQLVMEDISSLLQAAAAPLPITSLAQFLALNNNWTGLNSYSKQITSSVATGTAPFSIASTTVVPNLNAQLHGGLTAPASAILGLTDTQSPTNKTFDISANTLKNSTNTAGHYPRNNGTQYVDATIAAADLPATTAPCTGVQLAIGLNAGGTSNCATPPTFVASGASHAVGYVPDPGSSAGTTRFLREDATWVAPASTGYKIECVNSSPVTVTNTASETVLMSCSIPANELGNNQVLRLYGAGTLTTSATQTLTMRVRIGGVAGTQLGASDVAIANSSGGSWNLHFDIISNGVPSGSTATECQGIFVWNNGTTTPFGTTLSNSSTVSWATNSTLSLVITQAWSAAVTATVTERQMIVERLN